MSPDPFIELLAARAKAAGLIISDDSFDQLAAYFRLLSQWNNAINLTSLPLAPPTDQTLDRLLIEPISAARLAGDFSGEWVDVGSGGGSPAIPFRIVQPRARLTMVESRERKAAFLSDAVRTLQLRAAAVLNNRLEDVALEAIPQSVDLVTVRGVRCDASLFASIHRLLRPTGRLFLFQSAGTEHKPTGNFESIGIAPLGTRGGDQLNILKPLFHVEQSD